jgi:hypothetical protein
LSKPDRFNEAIRLCLELHGLVHSSQVMAKKTSTLFDKLMDGLTNAIVMKWDSKPTIW